jgi:hypothetical protein
MLRRSQARGCLQLHSGANCRDRPGAAFDIGQRAISRSGTNRMRETALSGIQDPCPALLSSDARRIRVLAVFEAGAVAFELPPVATFEHLAERLGSLREQCGGALIRIDVRGRQLSGGRNRSSLHFSPAMIIRVDSTWRCDRSRKHLGGRSA